MKTKHPGGRPPLPPRLRRQPFQTSIDPDDKALIEELVKKGHFLNQGKLMDWLMKLARQELKTKGVRLEALKVERL